MTITIFAGLRVFNRSVVSVLFIHLTFSHKEGCEAAELAQVVLFGRLFRQRHFGFFVLLTSKRAELHLAAGQMHSASIT